MIGTIRFARALILLSFLAMTVSPAAVAAKHHHAHTAAPADADKRNVDDSDAPVKGEELAHPVLWHQPASIATLDLFWGAGGKDNQPVEPFTFEHEDLHGTNPKFDARDKNGTKWRVKLGPEARPEVVASRLLWAVGYFVNDDYVLESADVEGLHLKRGARLARGSHIRYARFARKPEGEKKIGTWRWHNNPFLGTREFNGLRVMMALMNNWDLKDVNNAVYHDKQTNGDLFLVSDIGATFGTNGLSWTKPMSKGNFAGFKRSRFIVHTRADTVDFATPRPPTAVLIESFGFSAPAFIRRSRLGWIGRSIPREDARWIGGLLSQLSRQQLTDAFRAGHFPPEQIDVFVQVLESRIHALAAL